MENAVPAVVKTSPEKENKITKVEILAKQSKFEKLKKAMNDIGVTGMTVTQVLGCGTQKGAPEYYRGVEKFLLQMLLMQQGRHSTPDISVTVRFSYTMWKMS